MRMIVILRNVLIVVLIPDDDGRGDLINAMETVMQLNHSAWNFKE